MPASSSKRPSDVDRKSFAVAKLLRAKGRNPTADTVEMFAELLATFSADVVEREVFWCIMNVDGWVEPGQLVRRCGGGSMVEMTPEERADQAFAAFDKAIREHGVYKSIDFDDATINATVNELGGWVSVCDAPESEWKWFKKDFVRVYTRIAKHGPGRVSVGPLIGIADRDNKSKYSDARLAAHGMLREPIRVETGLPLLPAIEAARPARIERKPIDSTPLLKGPDDAIEPPTTTARRSRPKRQDDEGLTMVARFFLSAIHPRVIEADGTFTISASEGDTTTTFAGDTRADVIECAAKTWAERGELLSFEQISESDTGAA